MPDFTAWPTVDDLSAFVSRIAVIEGDAADFPAVLSDIIEDFEEKTGYKPFLGSFTPSARKFNPPGPQVAPTGSAILLSDQIISGMPGSIMPSHVCVPCQRLSATGRTCISMGAPAFGSGGAMSGFLRL